MPNDVWRLLVECYNRLMTHSISFALIIFALSIFLPLAAQSTARGEVISYNEANNTAILDLDASDLRFNGIPTEGGIVSLTVAAVTAEAYLLPAEEGQSAPAAERVRLVGFEPDADGIDLVIEVGRSVSVLSHLGGRDPLGFLSAAIGDEVRVDAVAALPTPVSRDIVAEVTYTSMAGDVRLNITREAAATQGLFVGVRGTLVAPAHELSFVVVGPEEYFTATASADVYVTYETLDDVTVLQIVPQTGARDTQNVTIDYDLWTGTALSLQFTSFEYGDAAPGHVVDIQAEGQQLVTDIPESYLDRIGVANGAYVVFTVNGVVRAGMVMDETMIISAYEFGGLRSNYVILRQSGILKLVYLQEDGRVLADMLGAEIGARVRMRAAQATETIIREEAIVKAVSEVHPDGYLYTDITPFELSFLEVLVGQYVEVQMNGIIYRTRVADAALLAGDLSGEDMLAIPQDDHLIISHVAGDSITAEGRFQVSVGDVVAITRAPN